MSDKDPLDDLPWPKSAEPSANVSESIRRECTHALGQKHCARAHRRAALSLLLPTVAIGIFTVLAILRGDPDETLRSALYGVAGWVLVLVVVLTTGLAFPPGRRPSRNLRIATAVAIPLVFSLYITATASAHDSFNGRPGAAVIGGGNVRLVASPVKLGQDSGQQMGLLRT
jgi:hypothetical protein